MRIIPFLTEVLVSVSREVHEILILEQNKY